MIEVQVHPEEEVTAEVDRLRQQVANLQAEIHRLKTSPPDWPSYPFHPLNTEPSLWDDGQDYKRLLESVTDYIYSVKVDGGRAVATLHGPACVSVTGYTPEEYQAEPHLWHRMIYERDRSLVMAQIAGALAGESALPVEHRIRHKSGAIRWVRNTPVLRYDHTGRYLGYDGLITDITDRKNMEATLRESEAKFRTLAEMTAAAIIIFQDNQIYYVNPAVEAITEYTQAELLAMNYWDIIHPDFQQEVIERGQDRQQGEATPKRYELKIIAKSGQIRWVDYTGGVIQFQGKPAVLGTAFDITERKQIEAELTRRNSELLSLQYAGATIAASLDIGFVLNAFTQEMVNLLAVEGCAILGWDQTSDETLLLAHTGVTHAANDQHSRHNFGVGRQALLERRAQQMSLNQPGVSTEELAYLQRAQLKSVLILPMEAQGYLVGLVELVEGRLERVFGNHEIALAQLLANQAAGAIQNARLYEQAQQEIRERAKKEMALRQSQARIRALLDTMPDTMFRMSRTGQYLDYHPGKDRDSAILAADCIGQNIHRVFPPEIAGLTLEYVKRALETGIIQIFEYQLPQLYSLQEFEIRLVVSGPDEVLGIVRNITERKRLMEQAIQAERLAALGRLSAALTHEINNPLQSMRTHLDLVLDFELEPGEDRKFLDVIRREIDRLNEITQRILNFARPHPASRRQINVSILMEDVLTLAGKQLQQNSLKVTKDFRQVPVIWGVPDQLLQVFLNIILNAYEVLPPNGQLHIAVFQDSEQITISFTNDGPIIAPEILPHIFEPFFTTKQEGSGLGLWVSHNLIQQHGGMLTAQNLGKTHGVAFTINLPING